MPLHNGTRKLHQLLLNFTQEVVQCHEDVGNVLVLLLLIKKTYSSKIPAAISQIPVNS